MNQKHSPSIYLANVNVYLMKENVIQINGGIKNHIFGKDSVCYPSTCICENGKHLSNIMDDSVITCDEIIEEIVTTNFNIKKATCKTSNLYIFLAF